MLMADRLFLAMTFAAYLFFSPVGALAQSGNGTGPVPADQPPPSSGADETISAAERAYRECMKYFEDVDTLKTFAEQLCSNKRTDPGVISCFETYPGQCSGGPGSGSFW